MHILSMTWLLVLAFPITTHAQDVTGSGSNTGSGAHIKTADEIFEQILQGAGELAVDSLNQLQIPEKAQLAWDKESRMLRQRMSDQRIECHDAVRRANRDQRLTKILQCQRALLLLETNLLRKEQVYLTSPRLSTVVMNDITHKISDLVSAEMTIIDGIDAGLFSSEEQLLTARTNLRESYRVPYWLAKDKVRVDRELTFLYFMAKELSVRSDLSSPSLADIGTCLDRSLDLLQNAKMAVDRQEVAVQKTAARSNAALCQEQIRNLSRADRQAASTVEN
jgi:hypothetical protein